MTNNNNISETGNDLITERKKRILNKRTFILLALSIALTIFLIQKLDFSQTIETLKRSNINLFLMGCCIYFLSNFLKAVRFKFFLNISSISLFKYFAISSFHNFFNQILPARTGELTFVYYAKKLANLEVAKGLHALLIIRLFDFIVISVILVTSLLVYYGREASQILLFFGIFFLILSIILLLNLKHLIIFSQKIFLFLTRKFNIDKKSLIIKINDKINEIVEEFNTFDTKKVIPLLTLTSFLVWGALYSLFYITIIAFGVEIPFLLAVVGSTGGVLSNVLPINSFGSFGTLEAGWFAGFVLVGMTDQNAIVTGFGYHLIVFLASAFIALVCLFLIKILDKNNNS